MLKWVNIMGVAILHTKETFLVADRGTGVDYMGHLTNTMGAILQHTAMALRHGPLPSLFSVTPTASLTAVIPYAGDFTDKTERYGGSTCGAYNFKVNLPRSALSKYQA